MKTPSIRFPRTIATRVRRVLSGRVAATLVCILLVTTGHMGEVALCVPTQPAPSGATCFGLCSGT